MATLPRLSPLPTDRWTDRAREVVLQNKTGVGKDGVPNVLATLVRHPDLLEAWYRFAGYVIGQSTLPARDRELLILRTAWLCRSPYEWGQHVVIGRQAGLGDAEIARVRAGAGAGGWTAHESALLRAADELHAETTIAEATWQALSRSYGEKQLLDVIFTVGQYRLVASVLNTLGVELDEGIRGLDHP